MSEDAKQEILKHLQEKVLLKKEVYDMTRSVFDELKKTLEGFGAALQSSVKKIDREILASYKELSIHEAEFTLADETLLFVMHSNIFTFDNSHSIWQHKYVQEDKRRSYCGKIFIYNFLSDSFKYNRINDVGYLIARIFVNREKHYFVEGRKQLGHLYNDFPVTILDSENLLKILETAILFSLDFDPFTPPIESIAQISVKDVLDSSIQTRIATGKRLGFQFEVKDNKEGNVI